MSVLALIWPSSICCCWDLRVGPRERACMVFSFPRPPPLVRILEQDSRLFWLLQATVSPNFLSKWSTHFLSYREGIPLAAALPGPWGWPSPAAVFFHPLPLCYAPFPLFPVGASSKSSSPFWTFLRKWRSKTRAVSAHVFQTPGGTSRLSHELPNVLWHLQREHVVGQGTLLLVLSLGSLGTEVPVSFSGWQAK